MSDTDLIQCLWNGEAFVPQTPFMRRRAEDRFGAGEIVLLEAQHERSAKSHRFYFAQLRELWLNLPEKFAIEQWAQSPEHLRKYALIKTGYSETQTFTCAGDAEAKRWAFRMRPIDQFSIVVVKAGTVVRYTAHSQSIKAMGAKDFQASKTAVIEFVEDLIGAERGAAAT
jgi:hypothetical protein